MNLVTWLERAARARRAEPAIHRGDAPWATYGELAARVARLAAGFAVFDGEEPRPGSSADLAIAALNGFAGDRLARDRNPLATTMSLRHDGRRVLLERGALATSNQGRPSIAVTVAPPRSAIIRSPRTSGTSSTISPRRSRSCARWA